MNQSHHGNTKHGLSGTRIYRIWDAMKRRCYDNKHKHYHKYGGRGVTVCKRWHDVRNFLEDMGFPRNDQSLDRINNNGNYCPKNCRWANRYVQDRNKSNNRYLKYNGRTMTLADWAKETKIPQSTLHSRIVRLKWPVWQALTTKPGYPRR